MVRPFTRPVTAYHATSQVTLNFKMLRLGKKSRQRFLYLVERFAIYIIVDLLEVLV